ncbi:MAG: hypothetical protein ACOYN3_06075 [Acidimicrobiia bacterium]
MSSAGVPSGTPVLCGAFPGNSAAREPADVHDDRAVILGFEYRELGPIRIVDLFDDAATSGVDSIYIESSPNEIWRINQRYELSLSDDRRTEVYSVRPETEIAIGALLGVSQRPIRRVVVTKREPCALATALTLTSGRYCDVRTRYGMLRSPDRYRHQLFAQRLVPLGIGPDGQHCYGERVTILHAPAADVPSTNIGLMGEYGCAFFRSEPRLGPKAAPEWRTVTGMDIDALPIRIGSQRSPIIPAGTVVTSIWGVFDPYAQRSPSPLLTRPLDRSPIEPAVLTALQGARRNNPNRGFEPGRSLT